VIRRSGDPRHAGTGLVIGKTHPRTALVTKANIIAGEVIVLRIRIFP
jgi:hypothetical protein